jgi:hypothetical protein
LTEEQLNEWLSNYELNEDTKNVALILAGNIP